MSYNDYMNNYDSYLKKYDNALGKYDKTLARYDKALDRYDGFEVKYPKVNVDKDVINAFSDYYNRNKSYSSLNIDNKRGNLDRAIDFLMFPIYSVAGQFDAITHRKNPLEAITNSLRASNPFGEGYEKGEVTFSNILNREVHPTNTLGKVATGVVGFALDVFLDPTTYLSGGTSALVKGTGKVGRALELGTDATKVFEKYGVDVVNGLNKNDAAIIIRKYTDDKIANGAKIVPLKADELETAASALSKKI